MDVVGGNRVDMPVTDALPQGLTVLGAAQGRVDLGLNPDPAGDVMRQVMDAGLDADLCPRLPLAHSLGQGRPGRGVNGMHPRACAARQHQDTLQRLGLDHRRTGGVPRGKAALALGICRHHPVAQNPSDFDILGVGAQHAAMGCHGFQKAEEKAIIGAGQAKTRALIAANVHEELCAGCPACDQVGQFGKLCFGRDHKVKAKVDPRARRGHGDQLVEHRAIGLCTHHIGDDGGHTAKGRRPGFAGRVARHPWARDVRAMAKVDMRVNRPRNDCKAGAIDDLGRVSAVTGRCNGGNPAIANQHIGLNQTAGQHHRPVRKPHICLSHRPFLTLHRGRA